MNTETPFPSSGLASIRPPPNKALPADVAQRVPIDLWQSLALNLGASATVGVCATQPVVPPGSRCEPTVGWGLHHETSQSPAGEHRMR